MESVQFYHTISFLLFMHVSVLSLRGQGGGGCLGYPQEFYFDHI